MADGDAMKVTDKGAVGGEAEVAKTKTTEVSETAATKVSETATTETTASKVAITELASASRELGWDSSCWRFWLRVLGLGVCCRCS